VREETREERPGDYVTGNREEDIDARKTSRNVQPGVVEDDEEDGDPAEPLDVIAPPGPIGHAAKPRGAVGLEL
jgi:hypothetical protein